jgi:hypothetical protein
VYRFHLLGRRRVGGVYEKASRAHSAEGENLSRILSRDKLKKPAISRSRDVLCTTKPRSSSKRAKQAPSWPETPNMSAASEATSAYFARGLLLPDVNRLKTF